MQRVTFYELWQGIAQMDAAQHLQPLGQLRAADPSDLVDVTAGRPGVS